MKSMDDSSPPPGGCAEVLISDEESRGTFDGRWSVESLMDGVM